jgi:hypothetical protein
MKNALSFIAVVTILAMFPHLEFAVWLTFMTTLIEAIHPLT